MSDEWDRPTKRFKSIEDDNGDNGTEAIAKSDNVSGSPESDLKKEHSETTFEDQPIVFSSFTEQLNDTFPIRELTDKLVPSLEALILRGCSDNCENRSALIKECSKYCPKNYTTIEMLAKHLSAIDLKSERNLLNVLEQNCTRIKCLRLSYCILSVDMFKSMKVCFPSLQCLHLEHIYGIETAEEWTAIGKMFSQNLINISLNPGSWSCRKVDLTGMLRKLKIFGGLAIEEYQNNIAELFSAVSPNINRLSLLNYYDIDDKAIEALALRCGPSLTDMEMTYDKYDSRRANSLSLFASICKHMKELTILRFKFIRASNMRPVFKLLKLKHLDLQFSNSTFVDFPGVYHLETLRILSLSNALFTPQRIHSMARAFPLLKELSLSGQINKNFVDSAVFCCGCKKKEKTDDNCSLCYQNCIIALIEFSFLKTIKLNYVRIKSSMSTALPYIPCLKRLVINPFDCSCSRSLLMAAIKIADLRHFKLIIRRFFLKDALKEETQSLPLNLEIIEYTEYSEK